MGKTYFLAPSRDCPPSGPIALGSIIESPRTPEIALNNRNSMVVHQLSSAAQYVVEQSAKRDISGRSCFTANVWANFLSFSGLGGGAGSHHSRDKSISYEFESLISKTISPDTSTIQTIFAEPGVQASLRESRFKANLYMIIGVQIAKGTNYIIAKARERGEHLHLSADLMAAAGVPVSVGGGVQNGRRSSQTTSGRIENEFVFAYRLREIVYKRKVLKGQKEHSKGDLLGKGERKEEEPVAQEGEYSAELLDLKPEDSDLPEQWGMDGDIETASDGEEYQCVSVTD